MQPAAFDLVPLCANKQPLLRGRVQERLAYLRRVRERGDVVDMMFAVRADLLRNLGNMTNRWGGAREWGAGGRRRASIVALASIVSMYSVCGV